MERPPRPDHPLEYSAEERLALITLMAVCAIIVAIVNYWPASPPPSMSPEEEARYLAEIKDFVRESHARSDSIAGAKADRKAAYAERQAQYEERRAGWAREREQRQARGGYSRGGYSSSGGNNRYANRSSRGSAGRNATAIDYDVAMPAPASLDANAVDSATLLRLGIPVAITARWLKYRRSGGRFRKASDISKLYGLSDTTAARITTYFSAPSSGSYADASGGRSSSGGVDGSGRDNSRGYSTATDGTAAGDNSADADALIDVNTATAEQLESLRGIGAYTATSIVRYRGWLGGYVSIDQLAEANGVRAENLDAVRSRLSIGTAGPSARIRVNAAVTFDEWRHPYLKWKKAKVLLAYREQHGPFRSADDLLLAKVVSPEEVARLAPYLDFGT